MGNKAKPEYFGRSTERQIQDDFNTFIWRQTIGRPTAASARRSKLWSRERQTYEEEHRQIMQQLFHHRPYLRQEYPELQKHYPGTWRTATAAEIDATVKRLSRLPERNSYGSNSATVGKSRQRLLKREQTHH